MYRKRPSCKVEKKIGLWRSLVRNLDCILAVTYKVGDLGVTMKSGQIFTVSPVEGTS